MNLLKTTGKLVKDAVLGEMINDWGTIYLQEGKFATEQLKLGLYRKNQQLNLLLNITNKTFLGPNTWFIVFTNCNIPEFVSAIQSNYEGLRSMACQSKSYSASPADRLPFSTRILLKLFFGLRGSKLLLDTTPTDDIYKIYGFITRNRKLKVLIAPNYISSDAGNVVSGDGFCAVIDTLWAYINEQAIMENRQAG